MTQVRSTRWVLMAGVLILAAVASVAYIWWAQMKENNIIIGGPIPFPNQVEARTLASVDGDTVHIVSTQNNVESIVGSQRIERVQELAWAHDALVWLQTDAVATVGGSTADVPVYRIASAPTDGSFFTPTTLYQSQTAISHIQPAPSMAFLSFIEDDQLYVLHRLTGSTIRIASGVLASAWSPQERALVVSTLSGVEYVSLDASGNVATRITMQGDVGIGAEGIAFINAKTIVLAKRNDDGAQLVTYDLFGATTVQIAQIPLHSEARGGVPQKSAQVQLTVASDGTRIAVYDPKRISTVIPVQIDLSQADAKPMLLSDKAHALRIDEIPLSWQDASTLIVLQGKTVSSLGIETSAQVVLAENISKPAVVPSAKNRVTLPNE